MKIWKHKDFSKFQEEASFEYFVNLNGKKMTPHQEVKLSFPM